MSENADHAQVMVPPPLIFLGFLIGALLINRFFPFPTPGTIIFLLISGLSLFAGVFLIISAFTMMRNAHTTPDPDQPTASLVVTGPYRFTRNPIYIGFFLIYIGFSFLAGTFWGILLSPFLLWTVTHAIIHAEEIYLENKFKDEYAGYASRVRRWI
jgi:protein-S-isoprenylcysteine O-methyltransferase Ste14